MSDLDSRFGQAIVPAYVHDCEQALPPRSLVVVKLEDGALLAALRAMFKAVDRSVYPSHGFHSDYSMIWVVDKEGLLRIGLEEDDHDRFSVAIPRSRAVRGRAKRGHPALVAGEAARIGGELRYDVSALEPKWVLSNRSGRYGLIEDRFERHLRNVAAILAECGVKVEIDFRSSGGA